MKKTLLNNLKTVLPVALVLISVTASAALPVAKVAQALITGPKNINEYSGVTSHGISCSASLTAMKGSFSGSVSYGDTGASVEADFTSGAEATTNANGTIALVIKSDKMIGDVMTLTMKDKKVVSISIVGKDSILFIPRTFTVACGSLQQFIPHY